MKHEIALFQTNPNDQSPKGKSQTNFKKTMNKKQTKNFRVFRVFRGLPVFPPEVSGCSLYLNMV